MTDHITKERRAELRGYYSRHYHLTHRANVLSLLDEVEALEAELAAMGHCWHCKTELATDGFPHCESCPEECDGCDAEGCVEQLAINDAVCPSNRKPSE